ncbi:hypothetical protein QR680_018866 [Steinernema hermaphroditum]|uniref:Uncharacterized protein n=1 Tax=Steinernema hermaphroditum TaxID=289476 RepID=A0AA39HJ89_9BILA|nr:hypothetical protein QR680_018866 [Steinernema hermaphroditum]
MKRPRRGGSPSCRPSSSLSDDVFGPPPRGADREEVPRFVSPGGYAVAASNEPAAKKHRPVRVKILSSNCPNSNRKLRKSNELSSMRFCSA